jgi:hypothetical protein
MAGIIAAFSIAATSPLGSGCGVALISDNSIDWQHDHQLSADCPDRQIVDVASCTCANTRTHKYFIYAPM